MKTTTSIKRTVTKTDGVFYKDIFNDKGKVVDKKYIIRWLDENGKDKLKTIGNYSQGIREKYCKIKRDEILIKIRLGEDLPHLAKPKQIMTIFEMSELYFEYKSSTVKDIDKEKRRFDNHLKKPIGNIRVQNLSEKDILKLQQDLKVHLAVATVRSLLVNLNAMYKYITSQKLYKGVERHGKSELSTL